jgi:hypothetical protein
MLLALALGGRRVLDRLRGGGRARTVQRARRGDPPGDGDRARDDARREARPVDRAEHPERQHHGRSSTTPSGLESRLECEFTRSSSSRVKTDGTLPRRATHNYGTAPQLRRHRGLVQHAGRSSAHAPRPARARRADRLLDLHLHQLHPHAPLPRGLGANYRKQGPDDRRHRVARVPFERARATSRTRSSSSASTIPSSRTTTSTPGTPGQNEYWPADYLIDKTGRGSLRDLRRGRLHEDRGGDPRAARGGRREGASAQARRPRHVIVPSLLAITPRPTSAPPARRAGSTSRKSARTPTAFPRLHAGGQRLRLRRHVDDRQPAGARGARRDDRRDVQAKNVYIVLSRRRAEWLVRPGADQRQDTHRGGRQRRPQLNVNEQRLYHIVSFAKGLAPLDPHCEFSPGTSGYSFTFG